MKASSLDLADKQELNFLAELIADLRAVAPHVGVLLVGVMARDLLLYYAHGIRAARATEDVDLALAVSDWNEFERLRESLLTSGSFDPTRKLLTSCYIGGGWKWTLFYLAEWNVPTEGLPGPRRVIRSCAFWAFRKPWPLR